MAFRRVAVQRPQCIFLMDSSTVSSEAANNNEPLKPEMNKEKANFCIMFISSPL
jgi:hypothetical protein